MDEVIKRSLEASKLLDNFESLAPSHQKEHLDWINQAKTYREDDRNA